MAKILFDPPSASGVGGSLSDADKAEIAKVAGLNAAIQKDGGELVAGETVSQGANRTYTIGDVVFDLENRVAGTRTVANPIDAAELDKWTVLGQFPASSLTFPAGLLIPKGYQLKHSDGAILQNKSTRVAPSTIDVTKWTTVVEGTQSTRNWILNINDDYARDEELFKGDDRRLYVVGIDPGSGSAVRMTYRGNYVEKCPELTATVLNDWEYVSQSQVPTVYPAGALAIKGFRYRRSGQPLKLKQNIKLPTDFDATQWEPDGSLGILHTPPGGSIDLLQAHTFPERFGVFANASLNNAPSNAGTNCTGNWAYSGDAKNGILTINVARADLARLVGGIWTIERKTTKVNNVDQTAWESWIKTEVTSWVDSTNNAQLFTGTYTTLLDGHNVSIVYVAQAPAYVRPQKDWGTVGKITANDANGAVIAGLPEWGNEVAEIFFDPGSATYKVKPSTVALRTVTYTTNTKILDRTLALINGATAMPLTTASVGRRIQAAWVGGTTAPTLTPASGQKLFGAIAPPEGSAVVTLNERDRVLTLIGRADGWQLLWGA